MINITQNIEHDVLVIAVVGDVDASSSIELDNAIIKALESGGNKILVDCAKLNYISSAGLGVFMSHIQELEARQIKMVLCNLNDKVQNTFKILGLDQLLKIAGNKDQAKVLIHEL